MRGRWRRSTRFADCSSSNAPHQTRTYEVKTFIVSSIDADTPKETRPVELYPGSPFALMIKPTKINDIPVIISIESMISRNEPIVKTREIALREKFHEKISYRELGSRKTN
jgi:hypothetical protein